jgi:hypothetical protein
MPSSLHALVSPSHSPPHTLGVAVREIENHGQRGELTVYGRAEAFPELSQGMCDAVIVQFCHPLGQEGNSRSAERHHLRRGGHTPSALEP